MRASPLLVSAVGAEAGEALALLHAAAFERPWTAQALAELIASPFTFALQAEATTENAPPLGFIVARAVAGEAEVLTLAVDPSGRRRGAGRRLVEAAAGVALAMGTEVLWLEVAEDNAAAMALYQACGFQTVGRRRGYYRRASGAVDALSLQRRLNSAPA